MLLGERMQLPWLLRLGAVFLVSKLSHREGHSHKSSISHKAFAAAQGEIKGIRGDLNWLQVRKELLHGPGL